MLVTQKQKSHFFLCFYGKIEISNLIIATRKQQSLMFLLFHFLNICIKTGTSKILLYLPKLVLYVYLEKIMRSQIASISLYFSAF